MAQAYGIHWFRRDLRVAGNPALQWSWKEHQGRVLGFFCFDHEFLVRPDMSFNRFQFFIHSLVSLREELRAQGGDLLVMDVGWEKAFPKLFKELKQGVGLPQTWSWNRDYEPFARSRDSRAREWLEEKGVQTHSERDHLLIEPHEVHRGKPQEGYQVYSPFARKWFEAFETEEVQKRVALQKKGLTYLKKLKSGKNASKEDPLFHLSWKKMKLTQIKDVLNEYQEKNQKKVTVEIPKAGSVAAFEVLERFRSRLSNYGKDRDFPALSGTSQLSFFFKNGSLTIAQVIAYLGLEPPKKKDKTSADRFFSELVWREFYYHILWRWPDVETQAFHEKYRNLKWENQTKWFQKWKEGQTGFPIVDAGMRELKQTGWMHNRVRMIVASFLTKDLLIDWRWGEKYFMEQLLDGDLAPNNGGWQWAASTGCDPQPYFRVFNPWLQGKKFDPQATYIQKYVPELKGVDPKTIHKEPLDGQSVARGYPPPLVNHSVQRKKAIALYKR